MTISKNKMQKQINTHFFYVLIFEGIKPPLQIGIYLLFFSFLFFSFFVVVLYYCKVFSLLFLFLLDGFNF